MTDRKGGIAVFVIVVIVGLIGLAVLGVALNLITIPWLKFERQVQTNRDIVEKTYTAENALMQYHWFQEKAEYIKATKAKVAVAKQTMDSFQDAAGPRSEWTFDDRNEYARLVTVWFGLQAHLEEVVAEYNARAKETDRAIFKDELPLFFSLDAY